MDSPTPGKEPALPQGPGPDGPAELPARELPQAKRPPEADELFRALGSTRVLADARGDEPPSSSDLAGLPPEGRRAEPDRKELGRLGEFVLLKKLGEGAMGAVYKAHQPSFNRNVALKVLFRHVANNPKLLERFDREARVAGRLDHPNVVRGYEVGEAGGEHYFAMEYVPGKSLQKVLSALRLLCVGDALYVVLRVARGLQYAHGQGLIHRDVKPDNIFITKKGDVKLGDLGMVKQLDEDMSLTQTGHAVGTPWYMPLEQARNSKDADARCDIYALGCVLYALLTGKPPFAAGSLVEVIQTKERGTFKPARQANPEVPVRLDDIIFKMTAKQPSHRYQGCAEAIRDLEGLGLAGSALSFLSPGGGGASGGRPGSSAETVTPSELTPVPGLAEPPLADVWYVRSKAPTGQTLQRKLTTAEVLELIQNEHFDPATFASRSPAEGFRALATYREFEPVVLGRAAKSGADRRASHYRKLFKKIEEEDQRKRGRAAEGPRAADRYWLWISLQLGGLLTAVGAAYLLVRWMIALAGA
jgi:serine/threonine-protein kinase